MKSEILKALKESGNYVSGQSLCERFGVSRTAVWKAIGQLREEGYEIEAVKNRGYRLVTGTVVYSDAEIKSILSTGWLGHEMVFLDEVDSTNNEARRQAEKGAAEGMLIVAERQTAGKGRRGRSWVSPKGTGVWMSFLLRPDFPPECASMMTLVAAMAAASGIREVTGAEPGIKWPNDIVLDGKKACGILTEMSCDMDSIQYVIVGIGINAAAGAFPEEIRETAVSLEEYTGCTVDRARLADAVLRGWEKYYAVFQQTLDLKGLIDEYHAMLLNKDRTVRVLAPGNTFSGVSRGITEKGELLVEIPGGEIRKVMSGEVSVRGIYGYV